MQTFELEHVDEEVRRLQEDEERQQDQRESIDDRENRMQENLRRLQSLGRRRQENTISEPTNPNMDQHSFPGQEERSTNCTNKRTSDRTGIK